MLSGQLNQTADLALCTAYTVHLHHTFTHTLESTVSREQIRDQSATVPNDLNRGQSGGGGIVKGCAEKDTAFRPFSYPSSPIHIHYRVFKKSQT